MKTKRSLSFIRRHTYERFETLIKRCRHIHCVQLKNCIVDSNLLAILKRNLSEISCLFLEDCYLYEPHKWEEHTPMGIKKLVFDNCLTLESDEDNQDQSLQIFAKLPSLRKLCIRFSIECLGFFESDIGTEEIDIVNNVPSSVDWLSLERQIPLYETLTEEHFNVQIHNNLKRLEIDHYAISLQYLALINKSLDLKKFSLQCNEINWHIVDAMAKKQTQLKDLIISCSLFPYPFKQNRIESFKSVKHLELDYSTFRSITDHRCFLRLFPKLFKLRQTETGVICEDNTLCKTCLQLTFNPFFKQLTSIRKLVICVEDVVAFVDVIEETNLNELLIFRDGTLTEEQIRV